MEKRFVAHDTFVIEKTYPVEPSQVFAAWENPEMKSKWFAKAIEFDFRVGGKETNQGGPPGGPIYTFEACYQEIVPNSRIVYSYTMDLGETRISVSLATIEFNPIKTGTQLIFTEQGAFLDGHDQPENREHGTRVMLDKLREVLS